MRAWEKVEIRDFYVSDNFKESIRNSFQNCFVIFKDNHTSIAVNYVDTDGQLKFDYVTTLYEDTYKAYEDLKEKVLEKSREKYETLLKYYRRILEEYKFLSNYNNKTIAHDEALYREIAKLYEYLNELEKNKDIGICGYNYLISLISQCVGLREKKFENLEEHIESVLKWAYRERS
jgi:hypothetical protein